MTQPWQTIVASSLDWEQAHASLESAVSEFPEELRGTRPDGLPHSAWELLQHIRLTQTDLMEFMENPNYAEPKWPDDYWPPAPAPPTPEAWEESLAVIRRDVKRIQDLATHSTLVLTEKIPWGHGQTYLRTILVAVDHTAYHVGQLVAVRRLLGAWPVKGGG